MDSPSICARGNGGWVEQLVSLDTSGQKWTVETLKLYVDQRLNDQKESFGGSFTAAEKAVSAALAAAEKAVAAALAAAEKAREAAEANSEKWRSNANEWRGAMMDRETKFMQKPSVAGVVGVIGLISMLLFSIIGLWLKIR
jgi:hypothetical protein